MELIYGELTGRLRGHIYDVHNELGVGYNEEAYHQALIRRFRKNDIPVVSKERKWLYHRGIPVRRFEHDLLVFDKIIQCYHLNSISEIRWVHLSVWDCLLQQPCLFQQVFSRGVRVHAEGVCEA